MFLSLFSPNKFLLLLEVLGLQKQRWEARAKLAFVTDKIHG